MHDQQGVTAKTHSQPRHSAEFVRAYLAAEKALKCKTNAGKCAWHYRGSRTERPALPVMPVATWPDARRQLQHGTTHELVLIFFCDSSRFINIYGKPLEVAV